ncbi:hypothetical protein A2U01_0012112, partial [Trifolium medium]|nr:hypothetical protein [Trifolium medium]
MLEHGIAVMMPEHSGGQDLMPEVSTGNCTTQFWPPNEHLWGERKDLNGGVEESENSNCCQDSIPIR